MDSKRRIDVGISSSLVDLKAELLKKHAELSSSRSRLPTGGSGVGVPKSVRKKDLLRAKNPYIHKNKGIDARAKRDLEEVKEEEKTIEKAKSILEYKAKLYERMTSEALDHDEHEHPVLSTALVNFTQKAIDNIKHRNELGPQQPQRIEPTIFLEDDDEDDERDHRSGVVEDEEEWTEFTDGLGRTRRCLKSDLPSFLSRDDELARPSNPGVCLSKEAEQRFIEMKRQKWEKETEEVSEKESVHYTDVRYDEVRTHGVGFYGFSKDEAVRADQLKELKKISAETEATKSKILKERSATKNALQDRLKKIRTKKRAKLGLPPEEEKSDKIVETATATDDSVDKEDEPSASKMPNIEEEKEKRMRAWDFGKPGVFGPKPETFDELDAQWLKDRRADRLSDFAPPKSYDK